MKRKFGAWAMTVAVLFSACTTPAADSEEAKARQELAQRYDRYPFMENGGSLFEEDGGEGIYILPSSDNDHLYYWEEETNACFRLCGKAECTHETTDCNSYVGGSGVMMTLELYEEQLYVWEQPQGEQITPQRYMRVDLDGSNREEFRPLDGTEQMLCFINAAELYEGEQYVVMQLASGTNSTGSHGVFRQKIGAEKALEPVYVPEDEAAHDISGFYVGGGYVYFLDTQVLYDGEDVSGQQSELYRWSIETEELELLYQGEQPIYYVVEGDSLIYCEFDPETWGYVPETRERDLKTGAESVLVPEGGLLSYDGEYLYIANNRGDGLGIYTLEGEFVDRIASPFGEGVGYGILTMPNYISFSSWEREDFDGETHAMLNKDQIGAEEKEFSEIEIPVWRLSGE